MIYLQWPYHNVLAIFGTNQVSEELEWRIRNEIFQNISVFYLVEDLHENHFMWLELSSSKICRWYYYYYYYYYYYLNLY